MWEKLVKLALLGAERTHLPESTRQQLEDQGIDTDAPFSTILLEAAALYNQFNKAAFPLPDWKDPLPEPIDVGEQQGCNVASSHHLKLILSGPYRQALPEFLGLLGANNQCLPPEALPPIFDSALRDPEFWALVRPTIGAGGHWLLSLNPDWQALRENTNISDWETSNREERTAIIRYLRHTDPQLAIVLLERTWHQDSVADKMAFLPLLEINIAPGDEDFLEARLDDSRKEVRQKAALLLATIKGSALQQRLLDQIQKILRWDNKKVEFDVPAELPETTLRDGIRPSPKRGAGGMKADWLQQLVGRIPPAWWEERLDRKPQQIASLFARGHWGNALLPALTEATLLHHNNDWIEGLLRYWQKLGKEAEWQNSSGKQLLQELSDTAFNQIIIEQLEQSGPLLEEHSLANHLLCLRPRPWPERLSQLLIRGFQQWLASTDTYHWNTWHYRRIFEIAAYSVPPQLLDSLKTGWNYKSAAWAQWDRDVERFLKVVAFRRDMVEGFKG
ncbi:MAG: hypothetical protein DHS20C18_01930 [Saprospiraceae bacterium]|nr:MAG: hypothetical protein DHS20C18_01930 [Saprospiraceae bacterium]